MTRTLLTIKETMDLARVSRRTVSNWIASGKVEAVKAGGGVRIYEDSVFKPVPTTKHEAA